MDRERDKRVMTMGNTGRTEVPKIVRFFSGLSCHQAKMAKSNWGLRKSEHPDDSLPVVRDDVVQLSFTRRAGDRLSCMNMSSLSVWVQLNSFEAA